MIVVLGQKNCQHCRNGFPIARPKHHMERYGLVLIRYHKVVIVIWSWSKTMNQEELAKAYPNLFRLLWQSTLPCYPPTSEFESSDSVHLLRKCSWQGKEVNFFEKVFDFLHRRCPSSRNSLKGIHPTPSIHSNILLRSPLRLHPAVP